MKVLKSELKGLDARIKQETAALMKEFAANEDRLAELKQRQEFIEGLILQELSDKLKDENDCIKAFGTSVQFGRIGNAQLTCTVNLTSKEVKTKLDGFLGILMKQRPGLVEMKVNVTKIDEAVSQKDEQIIQLLKENDLQTTRKPAEVVIKYKK